MPIEFHCPSCNAMLRVGEEHAGKAARCPQCQQVAQVPFPSAPRNPYADDPFEGLGPPPKPGSGDATEQYNPYLAPQTTSFGSPGEKIQSTGEPTIVATGDVFSRSWRVFQENLGLLVGVGLVTMVVSWMFAYTAETVGKNLAQQGDRDMAAAVSFLINQVGNLVNIFLGIGVARINLAVSRGQAASFGLLFSGADRYLPVLVGAIVAGVGLILGLLLLIVPGILLMLYYWPFYYFLVEGDGVLESFGRGKEIARLNLGTTVVLYFASLGIMILGALACLVGLIAAVPLVSLLWANAYLLMKGEVTA